MKKMDTAEFIAKAGKKHGDKYDYSKVVYQTVRIKVKIICPVHGEFLQEPTNHLSGRGCRQCAISLRGKLFSGNTEKFIKLAQEVHGKKYDYSLAVYRGYQIKLQMRCVIHGIFHQTPSNHNSGQGCPKCGQIKRVSNLKLR